MCIFLESRHIHVTPSADPISLVTPAPLLVNQFYGATKLFLYSYQISLIMYGVYVW